jgi:5-deoxy-glucuronate isomerase
VNEPHLRRGTAAEGAPELEVTPERAGWGFSGLRVLELEASGTHAFETGEDELIVLPLRGGCAVTADGERFTLHGRGAVVAEVSDFVYVPRDTRVELSTENGGRFALPSARAGRRLEPRYVAAVEVPVELRGAGRESSRWSRTTVSRRSARCRSHSGHSDSAPITAIGTLSRAGSTEICCP